MVGGPEARSGPWETETGPRHGGRRHLVDGSPVFKNFSKVKRECEAEPDMKKMPTLFKREFSDRGGILRILPEVAPGCEWVGAGEGIATEKVDGACCAIIGGRFYKRYDAKRGRGGRLRSGAIPCQREPDPITGHWPHWIPVDASRTEDKWFVVAWANSPWCVEDGTYEAVGPHFQANPYWLDDDFLDRHGRIKLPDCPRDFDGIREYLAAHEIEGIVWHRGNGEMCKIKRSDFGFEWPVKENKEGK